jgi:hypothetical protein
MGGESMSYMKRALLSYLIQHGFSNDEARSDLLGIRSNLDQRELNGIRAELEKAYRDQEFDWIGLLWDDDDECEQYFYAYTQAEARDFVTQNIWNVLAPDLKDVPPMPGC